MLDVYSTTISVLLHDIPVVNIFMSFFLFFGPEGKHKSSMKSIKHATFCMDHKVQGSVFNNDETLSTQKKMRLAEKW